MRRIYYRGGMSPFETFSPGYILTHNVIGSNVGNFLYLNGVLRALMTEDDTVLTANYYNTYQNTPEYVNENFDCFVIPLADAFRENFVGELNNLTKFVEKLTIPCYVIGVGLKAPYEPDFSQPQPMDKAVKRFVRAVLEKSACIGVRGELTGEYLKTLGFTEDRDFMVIGCPSMYSRGNRIHLEAPNMTPDAKVCFNSNIAASVPNRKFVKLAMKEYENHYFIGQVVRELRSIYLGAPYEYKIEYNFHNVAEKIYQEGRLRFFCNVPSWLDFMRDAELAFGSRLHGCIAAILADTPAILITKDSRTRELAEYHHLNTIYEGNLHKGLKLRDIVEKQDFSQIEKHQGENLARFAKFLEINDIPNIYENGNDPEDTPFDRKMRSVEHPGEIVPVSQCSLEEVAERNRDYFNNLDEQIELLREKNKELSEQLKQKNASGESLTSDKDSSMTQRGVRIWEKQKQLGRKVIRKIKNMTSVDK